MAKNSLYTVTQVKKVEPMSFRFGFISVQLRGESYCSNKDVLATAAAAIAVIDVTAPP